MRSVDRQQRSERARDIATRIAAGAFVAVAFFVAAIEVQDVLQGDLRLPMRCVDEGGVPFGCPRPRPNLWLATIVAAAARLVTFRLLRRVLIRRQD